ncbi:ParB/RepB/Spo0J family partition protein [Streptomyces swartbergensis]|uniref:ParB/RepB/Spo0J family partition protein n=1 Tax=Streptomyces swartbergensis TaxID=487165 RepID=UPI0037FB2740
MEHVEMLVAAGTPLPPIMVHRPTTRVIDGMHRLRAAMLLGHKTIAVRFFDGTEEDAFVLAVKSNITHGLPLSAADRRRAAERIITTHPRWSDRMIASVVGTSAKTVAEIRRNADVGAAGELTRIGRDGRVRPIDVSEGRRLAHDMIVSDPSLSLRQVARAAGISPETVRDVRNRVLRGEDPVPRPRPRTPGERGTGDRSACRQADLPGRGGAECEAKTPPAVVVKRLRADPALRLNENGRDLLRLLNIHTVRSEDWTRIIDSVPPHRMETVAQLARSCAEKWFEIASRIEQNASNTA